MGLGEYGTFRVRRYDYGLEPRTTTLEIHRGQFAGLVAAGVIDDFAAAWPALWGAQGQNVWRRLDQILPQ